MTPGTAAPGTATAGVTVRYFAAAAQGAGLEEETAPAAGSLGDLLAAAVARHGEGLARVLPACSVLVDGITVTDPATPLTGVRTVDLLPPFAGG